MARISSLREKPISQRPRRLAEWLNPTGARKEHSLIDKIYSRKNGTRKSCCIDPFTGSVLSMLLRKPGAGKPHTGFERRTEASPERWAPPPTRRAPGSAWIRRVEVPLVLR